MYPRSGSRVDQSVMMETTSDTSSAGLKKSVSRVTFRSVENKTARQNYCASANLRQATCPRRGALRRPVDRGRALSLHLFEHLYGDSGDRGEATVALKELYRRAGSICLRELPDYLPVARVPQSNLALWLGGTSPVC
jgi:hypothetical protein